MSYRDKRRGGGRGDGRRAELRLLEDEPATPSHGRRSRRSRDGDWLGNDWDREDWRDRYRALRSRSRWPLAFTAAGVVLLFFGGLMLVQPPGTSGALGGPCATASCDRTSAPASVPAAPGTTASGPAATPSPAAPSASARTSAPATTAGAPGPTSPAASASPALRFVRVSYALVRRWDGGFEGQFTITNKGHSAIRDWRLTVVLPDDHVESAWDASFQESGNTVTFIPPAYALSIAAGARVTEEFTATGTTVRPVSCTFSGAPC